MWGNHMIYGWQEACEIAFVEPLTRMNDNLFLSAILSSAQKVTAATSANYETL